MLDYFANPDPRTTGAPGESVIDHKIDSYPYRQADGEVDEYPLVKQQISESYWPNGRYSEWEGRRMEKNPRVFRPTDSS